MALSFGTLWLAHPSNRLDPKYHLFKREAQTTTRPDWITTTIADVMVKREDELNPLADL